MNTSRRRFLATAAATSTLLPFAPLAGGFWSRVLAAGEAARSGRVLVVVQLSGGNDGLNTVVPFAEDAYYRDRPTLAIGRPQVLTINDHCGFHPQLTGFAKLLEAGKLAVVQGVGYPNPNRSHFESMDIWHTAQRNEANRNTGWLGRYFDSARGQAGDRDPAAMHFGAENQPLALAAEHVAVPSVRSIDRFRMKLADDRELRQAVEQNVAAARPATNDLLQFVQASAASALTTSKLVENAAANYQAAVEYPAFELAGKLKTIAQLIDAELTTPVYYVTLDGFDTHSTQAAAHAGLLRQLADSVHVFVEDISAHGHGDRVTVLSFSEFGRRVQENASQGTDHGAAAPVFLAGSHVKSGLIGAHPSLTDLDDGDVKHHTDFRRIYASLLQTWLGVPDPAAILGARYEPLGVFSLG